MNGPQHYKEAEHLLAIAVGPGKKDARLIETWVAVAQVHATLALAAATLDARHHLTGETPTRDADWQAVRA